MIKISIISADRPLNPQNVFFIMFKCVPALRFVKEPLLAKCRSGAYDLCVRFLEFDQTGPQSI